MDLEKLKNFISKNGQENFTQYRRAIEGLCSDTGTSEQKKQ